MNTARRLFDIVAAGSGLVLLSPLLGLCAVAILLDDGPPVLFRQERVGEGGRTFSILKFRTMQARQAGGREITVAGDRRITRTGAFLRKWKLDELPQLWNVLRGDMTFVGPRPEVPRYVEKLPDHLREITKLRPGITDPASIRFRNESDLLATADDPERFYCETILPEKARLSLEYAESRTLRSDLRVVLQTLGVIAAKSSGRPM